MNSVWKCDDSFQRTQNLPRIYNGNCIDGGWLVAELDTGQPAKFFKGPVDAVVDDVGWKAEIRVDNWSWWWKMANLHVSDVLKNVS